MKIISGRAFLATDSGTVYYIRATDNGPVFREVLSSKKQVYSGVKPIKELTGGQAINFLDGNGSPMQIVDGRFPVKSRGFWRGQRDPPSKKLRTKWGE